MSRHVIGLLLVLLSALSAPGGLCLCADCPGSVVAKGPKSAAEGRPCHCHGKDGARAAAHDKNAPCPCCTKNAEVKDLVPVAAAGPERGEVVPVTYPPEALGFVLLDIAHVLRPNVEPLGPPGPELSTVVLVL